MKSKRGLPTLKVWFCATCLVMLGCSCSYWPNNTSKTTHVFIDEPERPGWMVYDDAFADAIQAHWLHLLEDRVVPQDNGRVVLHVILHPNGSLTDLDVLENTEGTVLGTLCQKAVLDLVPYKAWTPGMCELFGEARSFQVIFEFDGTGNGHLSYAEDWMLLARNHRAPSETYLVLASLK